MQSTIEESVFKTDKDAGTGSMGVDCLADAVRRGLTKSPKQLDPQYLYDTLGSRLFEAICALPEYLITRAEQGLLDKHAEAIVSDMAGPVTLLELGGGNGQKLAQLIGPLARPASGLRVELVDVSVTALELAKQNLERFPDIPVICHETTYELGLARVTRHRSDQGAMLVAFLGSNLGNLDSRSAQDFVSVVRSALREGDRFLLGLDLVKPESKLLLAYDDPLGVTAAFNKNILARLNRELGSDFSLEHFGHRAVWNGAAFRVEMHLESLCSQTVWIPATDCRIPFAEGETIWTESSRKYELSEIKALGVRAGFTVREQWVDAEAHFAVTSFEVV